MLRNLFPHPWLTFLLTLVWLMLNNTTTPGVAAFGLILGWAIPLLTAPYWPNRARLRNPLMIAEYILLVLWDITVANVVVAWTVLFVPNRNINSLWVNIPLDLRSAEAITVLAGTITMTPGTVSSDLSADGRSLLVHCLNADSADNVRAEIKQRYERRLMEIFE